MIRALDPSWLRPFKNAKTRLNPCGNRIGVLDRLPTEIRIAAMTGGDTTVMVWADCDDDCSDCEALKAKAWEVATFTRMVVQELEGPCSADEMMLGVLGGAVFLRTQRIRWLGGGQIS